MSSGLRMKDIAYSVIKNKIMSNEFKSGEYLEEKMLCDLVGVSRTPIREAINQLANEDFVIIRPNKGIFVTTIDIKKSKELFQVRCYLEPIVLELAWNNIEAEPLLEYRNNTLFSIESEDYKSLNEIDYEFHNYINSKCENEYFMSIINRLQDQFQRVRTLDYYNRERILGGANEHLQLIDFFIDNDLEKAKKLLLTHIQNTEKYFFKSLS